MTSLQITMALNIGSLILGVGAWIFAGFAIGTSKAVTSSRNTVFSFGFCMLALIFQLLEINNRVNIGDYTAIADTIGAAVSASFILTVSTVVLNVIACVKLKNKS